MQVINFIISPIMLTFIAITFGLLISKIKIKGISLDLSAILIVSVLFGYLINFNNNLIDTINLLEISSFMKNISSLGTALFVSCIGLNAGYSLKFKGNKNWLFCLIGPLMVLASFIISKILVTWRLGVTKSTIAGLLCGALTTTPGLSVICEKSEIASQEVMLGYGCSYLFGTIFTVLSVQLITKSSSHSSKSPKTFIPQQNNSAFCSLMQIGVVIIIGKIIGNMTVPIIDFSLGSTGGILCIGILIGYLINNFAVNKVISKEIIDFIRNFGLALFFVGNGIPAGIELHKGFNLITIIIGIVLTVVPILIGFIICKLIFHKDLISTASIIAGGMTSTPAIGVISSKCDVEYDKYSLTYVFALITIVLIFKYI